MVRDAYGLLVVGSARESAKDGITNGATHNHDAPAGPSTGQIDLVHRVGTSFVVSGLCGHYSSSYTSTRRVAFVGDSAHDRGACKRFTPSFVLKTHIVRSVLQSERRCDTMQHLERGWYTMPIRILGNAHISVVASAIPLVPDTP